MSNSDVLFENFEFRKFIQSQNNSSNNQKLNLQMAQSHYFLNEFDQANLYFEKLNWEDEKLDLENHLFYANSLKNEGKIDEAKKQVQVYLTFFPKNKNANLLLQQIENYSKTNSNSKAAIILHNLEQLNTSSAQFSPFSKENKLYFVSENRNSTFSNAEVEINGEDLTFGKSARPETGIYFQSEESTEKVLFKIFDNFNIGAFCWDISTNSWLLTLTPKAKKWQKINQYSPRIYSWKEESSPEKLKIKGVKGGIGVGHPALSADGKYLVFSMDKGINGSDLYVSTKISDLKWSKPTKLPSHVNTFKDEVYPIIDGDSVLYFSSDGKVGFGGLDIYKINFTDGKVEGEALLLQKPFNSETDDYSILFKDDLKTQGFVVSDREYGTGDADIYFFNTRIPWKLELMIQNEKGELVLNQDVQFKVNSIEKPIRKLNSGKFEQLELDPNSTVSVQFTYSDSLINQEMKLPNRNGKDTTLIVVVKEKRKKIDVSEELSSIETIEKIEIIQSKTFSTKSVYFDFNKFSITKTFEQNLTDLAVFLKENTDKQVIVKTFSDERGDILYNLELTTKRAKEIYVYLVKKGVNPKQIKLQSLGEAVYDEKCSPNCDESIHSKYRRADFEIK